MSDVVIEMSHVSKRYLLGRDHATSLRDTVTDAVRRLRSGAERTRRDELWSLLDLNLEVRQGTALGLVGPNGAGKSTVLKILSRITEPTYGRSQTRGRVASLLEIGTGFHPELSGKENIYLNGAILGMHGRDIDRRLDEIVGFAGVERFLDTPIKRYSSGMHLRLAFAVAAHLETDILLVDEVLAVGDAEFQRKCLDTMASAERAGRTVVFVSHDLGSITSLCEEAVWLEGGRAQQRGPAADVVSNYLASFADTGFSRSLATSPDADVTLGALTVRNHRGQSAATLARDRPFSVTVSYRLRTAVPGMDCAIYVSSAHGVRVFDEMWSDRTQLRPGTAGEYAVTAVVPPVLNVGDYTLGLWLGTSYDTFFDEPNVARIRLEGSVNTRPERLVEVPLEWSWKPVDDGVTSALAADEVDR